MVHDNGGEFTGCEFQELLHSYGIQPVPTTVKTPTANAEVERIHLTKGDVLRMKVFEGDEWWEELDLALQAIAWAFRTNIPSTLDYSPGTMAFQHDMIMQTKVYVDWELIKRRKKENMIKNNEKENKDRLEHEYSVGDSILIVKSRDDRGKEPKLARPTEGPYTVVQVHPNATITIHMGACKERIHIRRTKPFRE